MWNELSEPWRSCLELAWESYREGSVPIGAIITGPDMHIVARGRNRRAGGLSQAEHEITKGPLAHAEVNAILALDSSGPDPRVCELYTLVEPCPLCIGAICMAGIKLYHYAATDAWSGSTDLLEASRYLRWKAIRALQAGIPHLSTVVTVLQVDAWIRLNPLRLPEVLECWRGAYPTDVALGQKVHRSGELQLLATQGASAEEAIVHLARLARQHAEPPPDAA
jgi:tRNA(adenine34) deaminase